MKIYVFSRVFLAAALCTVVIVIVTPSSLAQYGHDPYGQGNSDIHQNLTELQDQLRWQNPSGYYPQGSSNASAHQRLTELQDQVRQQYPSAHVGGGHFGFGLSSSDIRRELTELQDQVRWQQMQNHNGRNISHNMAEYPQRLRRQAQLLGDGGQFDYVAASGSSTPSAISAINASMRENAANNRIAEDDANVQWRRDNAEDVYNNLKELNPDSPTFEDDLLKLDPRVLDLPGVKNRVRDLQHRNEEYRSQVGKALEEENDRWDTLMSDAKKYGTRDEYLAISELRDEGADLSAAEAFADGEDAFYRRHERALLDKKEKDAYAAAEADAQKVFDRKTGKLNRANKRLISQRDSLEKRLDAAITRREKYDGNLTQDNKAIQAMDARVTSLEQQLAKTEESLSAYYDGIAEAENELDAFYNPEKKKELILKGLNEAKAKAEKDAFKAEEKASRDTHDRKTSALDRKYKGLLGIRDALQKVIDAASLRVDAAQDELGDEGAEKLKRMKTHYEALQAKMDKIEEDLSPYYEGVSRAEDDLAAFYNSEKKKEQIIKGLNEEEAKNAVQDILND